MSSSLPTPLTASMCSSSARSVAVKAALLSSPKELIDRFVTGPMSAEAVNAASMAFKKTLIERALCAELSHLLGYALGAAKPENASNHRNGASGKTVLTGGTRDILGLWIETTEGAKFWLKVFNDPKTRRVADILTAVTDGLPARSCRPDAGRAAPWRGLRPGRTSALVGVGGEPCLRLWKFAPQLRGYFPRHFRRQFVHIAPVGEHAAALAVGQLGDDTDALQVGERLVDCGRR